MMHGTLYLIPTVLGTCAIDAVIPAENMRIIRHIRHFIVENIRTTRRYLRQIDPAFDIENSVFTELNRHTEPAAIAPMLQPLLDGYDVGVISEAGCPAIADPGANIVAIAQERGLRVQALVGPSSILLGLMASGFNGQNFAFNGYLPIDKNARLHRIKELEHRAMVEGQTQIFIETPYRNTMLVADLARVLQPRTLLCIAAGLTTPNEKVRTLPARLWMQQSLDFLHKTPAIFLIFCKK